jgi:hypothetical protein
MSFISNVFEKQKIVTFLPNTKMTDLKDIIIIRALFNPYCGSFKGNVRAFTVNAAYVNSIGNIPFLFCSLYSFSNTH